MDSFREAGSHVLRTLSTEALHKYYVNVFQALLFTHEHGATCQALDMQLCQLLCIDMSPLSGAILPPMHRYLKVKRCICQTLVLQTNVSAAQDLSGSTTVGK
jgi:hypothetical protein